MFYILLAKIVIIYRNTKQKRQNFYIFCYTYSCVTLCRLFGKHPDLTKSLLPLAQLYNLSFPPLSMQLSNLFPL